MAVHTGLSASSDHPENGMTEADMRASRDVANRLNEVIIFRSTGPWAKRWLERGYPSKNFHVKGKSSDWGPHAGLVPFDGVYSKVGYLPKKAADGTQKNRDGLASGFAGKAVLKLRQDLLNAQIDEGVGRGKAKRAIRARLEVPESRDLILTAHRSGDSAPVFFRAFYKAPEFEIWVYPLTLGIREAADILRRDASAPGPVELEVMTSKEAGANNLPMTGDYDLMAVCPSWAQYGNRALADIVKPGIVIGDDPNTAVVKQGMAFRAGVGMDNVMDARLHTGGKKAWHDFNTRKKQYLEALKSGRKFSEDSLKLMKQRTVWNEHGDMGNLTPRILRCINELNAQMGATGATAAMRRVHHNAESHRAGQFGGITKADMERPKPGEEYGDGFPLTVFQPAELLRKETPAKKYGDVCTLDSLADFQTYATDLKDAGYMVPKSMLWGMR